MICFLLPRGKKKLERALQQAQQDILSLTEKLIRVQNGKLSTWSNHQWQLIQTSLIHSYLLKVIILICHVQSTSTLIQQHHLLDIFVVFLISGMYTISSQNCPSLIIHLESSVSEVALWIHVQIQYCMFPGHTKTRKL